MTWRIHGDVSMGLGGLRALLLQALHPLAMAGVAQHSSFEQDPWGRLMRTGEYVATVTYGTTEEAYRAGRIVQAVHRPLAGVEPESGLAYRVSDPHLIRWVHCAEIDSFLSSYQQAGGRLTAAEADTYVAEQVRAGQVIGLDPATVPASVDELAAYFTAIRSELRATEAAHRALRFVLSPPLPLPALPAWAPLAMVAFRMLPLWARALYGLSGAASLLPGTGLFAGLTGRSLRGVAALVPPSLRDSPYRKAAYARLV